MSINPEFFDSQPTRIVFSRDYLLALASAQDVRFLTLNEVIFNGFDKESFVEEPKYTVDTVPRLATYQITKRELKAAPTNAPLSRPQAKAAEAPIRRAFAIQPSAEQIQKYKKQFDDFFRNR